MNSVSAEPLLRSLQIQPNPVKEETTISFSLATTSDVQIILVNLIGETVLKKNFFNQTGEFNELLNLENLPEGVYLLSVDIGKNQKVFRKIVKV